MVCVHSANASTKDASPLSVKQHICAPFVAGDARIPLGGCPPLCPHFRPALVAPVSINLHRL